MLLHIKFPLLLLEVLHYGVEAGTTGLVRDGNFVHVELHGYDATTIESAYLVGDIEDDGGVLTVIELHLHVHVVSVVEVCLCHLLQRLKVRTGVELVWIELGHAEGQRLATYHVHRLALLVRHVLLHSHVEVYGDGVRSGHARIDIDGTSHAAEVGVAVDGGNLPAVAVVMMENHLH